MLPPIDSVVLERNPRFKTLYENLCSQKLTPEGATKDVRKEKARQETMTRLEEYRKEKARADILRASLHVVAQTVSELPTELVDVIGIVCAQLNGEVSMEDREMLEDDVDYFLDTLKPISQALSAYLTNSTHALQIIAAGTRLPSKQTPVSSLPSEVTSLRNDLRSQPSAIGTARLGLEARASTLQSLHLTLAEALVRTLEQVIHGAVSRGTRARAEHLALVAEGLNRKTSILSLGQEQNMDERLARALTKYGQYLDEVEGGLLANEQEVQSKVDGYEQVKGMREMVQRWREVRAAIEEVKSEIEKLEQAD